MNVFLLNPPAKNQRQFIREGRCTQEKGVWGVLWPPVSLATIGAVLEQDGHRVRIIDCPAQGVSWDALLQTVGRERPGLVIWSTGTPSIESDLSLSGAIKQLAPDCCTAVFGTHVTALDRQCLQEYPELDCIIRNEPEITARELARTLRSGGDFGAVAGLTRRAADGSAEANDPRPFADDLDGLPLPAWHLIDIDCYRLPLKGRRFLIVAPQRGCPFSCSFCTCHTYYGRRLRTRSPASVVAEIVCDIDRYGVRDFFMWAETFVVDRDFVAAVCTSIIESGLEISWTCNSRVDIVDEALLRLMKKAGCWMISFGIESADQQVLDMAGKGITPQQAADAVKAAGRQGIKTAGHFILGLPGDSEQSINKTIAFARTLGLDIAQFYCCVAFPGSRLYEEAARDGLLRGNDFSAFTQGHASLNLPGVSAETVEALRRRAYKSFYLHPMTWYRTLKMFNIQGIRTVWNIFADFTRWSG